MSEDYAAEEDAFMRFRECLPRSAPAAKNFVKHVLSRSDKDKDGHVRWR